MSTPWCVCRFCGDRFSGLYCANSRIRHEAKYCKKRKGDDVQVRKIAFKPDPPPAAASSDCAPSTSTAPQPALGAVASDPSDGLGLFELGDPFLSSSGLYESEFDWGLTSVEAPSTSEAPPPVSGMSEADWAALIEMGAMIVKTESLENQMAMMKAAFPQCSSEAVRGILAGLRLLEAANVAGGPARRD